jgi:hypothetical protein
MIAPEFSLAAIDQVLSVLNGEVCVTSSSNAEHRGV